MESHKYITRKRARFKGLSGKVNIPYGSLLESRGGFLFYKNARLCTMTSQNAYDYFSIDDDGRGLERGGLVDAIKTRLAKRDGSYQARGIKCGARWYVRGTGALTTMIFGCGTMIFIMRRWRICSRLQDSSVQK